MVLILQKDDLRAVVDYLRADGNVSLIGLWGRSMGAVTRLVYSFFSFCFLNKTVVYIEKCSPNNS